MEKRFIGGWAAALVLAAGCGSDDAAGAGAAAAARGDGEREGSARKVLKVERMIGVAAPYTGARNPIRGVVGGGLPWVIDEGEAKLTVNGVLSVEVEGLVIDPNDANAQARGLAGRNPSPTFRAIVSCQTVVAGEAAVVNVVTGEHPATTGLASEGGGDAAFSEQLTLPSPCYAPIVFVTSAAQAWFATSGL